MLSYLQSMSLRLAPPWAVAGFALCALGGWAGPSAATPAAEARAAASESAAASDETSDATAGAGGAAPPPPRRTVEDEITVSGGRPAGSVAPASAAATALEVEPATAPATLTELVAGAPGVSQNGQGGLFQVFSVRGVSRQRVQTRIDGVRLSSERRAGVSASFLDPQLLASIDVLRGPASSLYGSGALGGLVQLFPASFDRARGVVGYDAQGDERYASAGWGNAARGWSVGVAHREAANDETAGGETRNSGFSQTSAVLRRGWRGAAGREHELLVVPTWGEDIGKANADFPRSTTIYPRERHLLLRYRGESAAGASVVAWMHPHDLETLGLEPASTARVENRSFDLGGGWRRPWSRGVTSGAVGVEYFGRRGVSATERELVAGETASVRRTLDDGEVDEAAVYASAGRRWGRAGLEAGARYTWLRQSNAGAGADRALDDSAWSGFAGVVVPLARGFEMAANAGTGLRFPSLSERFFTGTTGRGAVVANPDLEPERSLSFDAGLRRYGARTFAALYVFRNRIDDYIERVELEPGVRGFVNLTSGTIEGAELELVFAPTSDWRLSASGHLMQGRSRAGAPLEDIPADRLEAGVEHDRGRWRATGRWQHRFAKSDPGAGERALGAADVVSATLGYRLRPGLVLTLRGDNLLDELYFAAADDQDVPASGRSLGLALAWSAD